MERRVFHQEIHGTVFTDYVVRLGIRQAVGLHDLAGQRFQSEFGLIQLLISCIEAGAFGVGVCRHMGVHGWAESQVLLELLMGILRGLREWPGFWL